MAQIKQNKLIPILSLIAVLVVGFVYFTSRGGNGAVVAGKPLDSIPAPRGADADTPDETIRTLTAEVTQLKVATQQIADQNNQLQHENAQLRANENTIVERVRTMVREDLAHNGAAGTSWGADTAPPSAIESTVQRGMDSLNALGGATAAPGTTDMPAGLGYDTAAGMPANTKQAVTGYTMLIPLGMKPAQGGSGQTGLVRARAADSQSFAPPAGSEPEPGGLPATTPAEQNQTAARKPEPYFTLPENATLTQVTSMTALVGRIPIDGRVQDPMQFKLLVGRDNLAANGQFVPDDVAGMIVSGIAVGDMTLSCSEGLIQSLTFIFNDGTIQTVSRRKDGGLPALGSNGGGTQGGGQASITHSSKLGYLSDEYGNPCIAGEFVTNAPSYLATTTGLKTLSIAARAAAQAETTTMGAGLGFSTGVTGNKNTYLLGEAAGGAIDEVSSWIMRRLNNSFDAVVTPAGARLVVHIDQEIHLDKDPNARRLDYGHLNGPGRAVSTAFRRGARHGLD